MTEPRDLPAGIMPEPLAAPRSMYQADRQRTRDRRGKYEEMNRCDLCAKAWSRDEYQQISDDKELQAAVVAAGGPAVGCVCHKCIKKLLPDT